MIERGVLEGDFFKSYKDNVLFYQRPPLDTLAAHVNASDKVTVKKLCVAAGIRFTELTKSREELSRKANPILVARVLAEHLAKTHNFLHEQTGVLASGSVVRVQKTKTDVVREAIMYPIVFTDEQDGSADCLQTLAYKLCGERQWCQRAQIVDVLFAAPPQNKSSGPVDLSHYEWPVRFDDRGKILDDPIELLDLMRRAGYAEADLTSGDPAKTLVYKAQQYVADTFIAYVVEKLGWA